MATVSKKRGRQGTIRRRDLLVHGEVLPMLQWAVRATITTGSPLPLPKGLEIYAELAQARHVRAGARHRSRSIRPACIRGTGLRGATRHHLLVASRGLGGFSLGSGRSRSLVSHHLARGTISSGG